MQQMFPCHKCGWQNVIGQRFCGNCAEIFEYNCPYCNVIVDPGYSSCPSCGSPLVWGYQQTIDEEQYLPDYDNQFYEPPQEAPQATFPDEQGDPDPPLQNKQKIMDADKLRQKKKNQLIVVIAFIGLVLCIGGAVYLGLQTIRAANSDPPVSATDNHTSQQLSSLSAISFN